MRKTNVFEKLLPSVINASFVFLASLPLLKTLSFNEWKIAVVAIFFIYNLFFLVFNGNRCLGMILVRTRWGRRAGFQKEFLYICLYTLSFSTLFMSVWFPFDVFLANMLLLQVPSILFTGTTFHGYLSGNTCSVIERA